MAVVSSMIAWFKRIFGSTRRIGEEEFKQYRRTSLDPVTRSGACYVPMLGFESIVHYQDKQNLHHLGRYEWAVRVLADRPDRDAVLDCACGVGYGSLKLSKSFGRVEAVDIYDAAIEMARERYDAPSINWHCMDAAKLRESFADESFDAIVSMQTIESIPDDLKFLDDLKALLKPGGVLLIDTPIRKSRVEVPENRHHKRYYGIDEWLEMLGSRFEVKAFGSLPEANFLERCQLPSQGSIAYCTKAIASPVARSS